MCVAEFNKVSKAASPYKEYAPGTCGSLNVPIVKP